MASNVEGGIHKKNHRNLAIKEMYENGIPASIKLAQAIIESGNGNSRLAREANNHLESNVMAGTAI